MTPPSSPGSDTCDAVVVGGGHNGLVAATHLADAGWDVVVVEAQPHAGGAVRTDRRLSPEFATDVFSAFYPMTAASPVMKGLGLEDHGLRWVHAPKVLANVRPGRPAAVLHRDPRRTAADLHLDGAVAIDDRQAWLALQERWERHGPHLLEALLHPFPPVRAAARLGWTARADLWDLVRLLILPVRTLADENFGGEMAPLLLAGNALHADVAPEATPSGFLGWMLVGLAQTVGFPVPEGGAAAMVDAMLSRLDTAGGQVRLGLPVERITVHGGRATGVVTADGVIHARRAILAACDAEVLYGRLIDEQHLPPAYIARLRQFGRAGSTVKVNYALSSPVPWTDDRAVGAGTVHVADSVNELSATAGEISAGLLPSRPFLLMGQMTTSDPSRSPAGTESLWVYTHVPQRLLGDASGEVDVEGRLRGDALATFVGRMEQRIEEHAPGFAGSVIARDIQGPDDLEAANASLVGGDISGGTTQLHQQLVFRPVPGLGRAETPITGLYLASSSAHPGGSVHGAGGANAARAALVGARVATARRAAPLVAGGALLAALSTRTRT